VAEQSSENTETTREQAGLPLSVPPANHGHTIAAWTTIVVILVGALVSAMAVVLAVVWLFWVGLGVIALGVVVGKVLQVLGYGQGGEATIARQSGSTAH
jgi:hypothetical protein